MEGGGSRSGECVYCGRVRPLTVDHIPPQSFCGSPRPHDLIKVPSCDPCNSGASKDDEYFKTVMVLKNRAGEHSEAQAIRPSVYRALGMPQKEGFKESIAKSRIRIPARTAAGLHVTRDAMTVDVERLGRVVERVVRGLHWHHHNHVRLAGGCRVMAWSESSDYGAAPVEEPHALGRGVLRYSFEAEPSDPLRARPTLGRWILVFFENVKFLAVTLG